MDAHHPNAATTSPKMRPKKAPAIPLTQFLADAITIDDPAEALPEGPTNDPAASEARKVWIAEWGGRAEILGADVLATRAPGAKAEPVESFKSSLDLSLREFLSNGDLIEATRCLLELGTPQYHYQIVKRGVTLAMDKAGREREMIAILLSTLHVRGVLTSTQACEGFRALLESIEDLVLDCPDAPGLVSHFLADAHLDGTLLLAQLEELETGFAAEKAALDVLREARRRLMGRVPTGGSQDDPAKWRRLLRGVVEEYLSSHDVAEVGRRVTELCVPADLLHELVRAAIELALERKDHDRELVSQLLSTVHEEWLPADCIARGFEQLLCRVDDLAIDNPRASEHLANFLTRAVADEVLPPAFVATPPPEKLASKAERTTLTQARAPLAASHFGDVRRHVWGKGADVSLDELKKEVSALTKEYIVSGELDEAVRCVRELEAPSFHHEVVKRLVSTAIADGGPRELSLASTLTEKLCEEGGGALLTPEQLAQGCTRLLEALPDLRLDHPKAPSLLADYIEHSCKSKLLPSLDEWTQTVAELRTQNGKH